MAADLNGYTEDSDTTSWLATKTNLGSYLLLTAFGDSLDANDDNYLTSASLTGYTQDSDTSSWLATQTWVNANDGTGTDDQTIDIFSGSGNTISLSLESGLRPMFFIGM